MPRKQRPHKVRRGQARAVAVSMRHYLQYGDLAAASAMAREHDESVVALWKPEVVEAARRQLEAEHE